jgi:hypothetical protein
VILFFDRNLGRSIPQAFRMLGIPDTIEAHHEHFPHDVQDDVWLAEVGARGWIVVTQDYKFHRRPHELAAIKQHGVGVFYVWGAGATMWEVARVFVAAYDRICEAASTPRPFVYRVHKDGRLTRIDLR